MALKKRAEHRLFAFVIFMSNHKFSVHLFHVRFLFDIFDHIPFLIIVLINYNLPESRSSTSGSLFISPHQKRRKKHVHVVPRTHFSCTLVSSYLIKIQHPFNQNRALISVSVQKFKKWKVYEFEKSSRQIVIVWPHLPICWGNKNHFLREFWVIF